MKLRNKVQLIGNIGGDPELMKVGEFTKVSFSMATNEVYKNKSGEKITETTWHNIEVWGRVAEIVAQYFKKGDMILVEGKLTQQTWEKDGQKHYKTVVKVHDFEFVGGKGSTDNQSSSAAPPSGSKAAADDDDDLPF